MLTPTSATNSVNTGHNRWAGVIGSPISHSLSPILHRSAWDTIGISDQWQYVIAEQNERTVGSYISSLDTACLGLSVTMPCKRAVVPHLDAIEPLAQAVGSVNTVVSTAGLLTGFNTDVVGMTEAIREARERDHLPQAQTALILGAGATASSALAALGYLHVPHVSIAARRFGGPGSVTWAAHRLGVEPEIFALSDRDKLKTLSERSDIIISTLPAGVADSLVDYVVPHKGQCLLDVVYNPLYTQLARTFAHKGSTVVHALDMLLHQGIVQVRLMVGQDPDLETVRRSLYRAADYRPLIHN